ncbi:MAG: iron ABC transporter permease [Beijerinckiaceae bacterium]|nr:iron ABC transporter permease [Beijerinckiaceae bacterium]
MQAGGQAPASDARVAEAASGPGAGMPPRLQGDAPRVDAQWAILGSVVAVTAWLALVPLGFLVWQSFLTPHSARAPARFTLKNYIEAYTSVETLLLFFNSLQFAIGAAVLALVVGTALAWVNERTNTPLKPLFYALSIIPLIIPGILFVVSWIMLASPKIGIINLVLQSLFSTDHVFVDIYSMSGMIWVDGLHYAPIAFLLMTAAFRSMDPSLEESAMMCGASMAQIARRITLKLAWPAIAASFLILFVRSIESFEVPALLGLPVGLRVFTSSIYDAIHAYPSNIGLASAYAITLLVITMAGVTLQSRVTGQGHRYSTVTGKGFRPRRIDLGRWKYLTAGLFLLYATLVVILPFCVLVWSSLQKYYAAPSMAALQTLSFDAYRTILNYPSAGTAVWNSVVLSLGSATAVMALTAVICWIVLRTKIPGRALLDNMASAPLVMPGLVMGLAIMICYLTIGGGVYGTIWILFIAYVTRFMPYGMRYNAASMAQLHRELEESAAMAGATWFTAFRRIVLPLLKPGLIAGWIYIVIVSVRELSSSILLYSPGTEVVSIVIWELWQNGQYVELSAFGVMLIGALFVFVMVAQLLGKRFGIKEA